MKNPMPKKRADRPATGAVSEILIWPGGKIFAHNLTPEIAGLLAELNPADQAMNRRARRKNDLKHELSN
jgi:hypothetical protein